MSTATMKSPTERAAWLQRRRRGVGASEIGAIMGLSPFATALDVYASKLGLSDDQPESMPMRIGTALEPGLKRLYEEETGRIIAATQVEVESERYPFLIATLDGLTADGRIIEFKTVGSGRARELGEDGTDELPPHFLTQAHHQMVVMDETEMDFAVLTGGRSLDFRIFTVKRDDDLANAIIDAASHFWSLVLLQTPPPISAPSDLRYLSLFGEDPNPAMFDFADAEVWHDYQRLGAEIAERTKERDTLKGRIHEALGTRSTAILPDGGRIVRKLVERKEYTCKATSYHSLTFKKGE